MFHQRMSEWVSSLVILAIGLISLIYPQTFLRPSLIEFYPIATTWTWLCIVVGVGRILSLIVNGHWSGGTPALRIIGSVIGAGMFGALVGNLATASDIARYGLSWGVGTYSILLIAELVNAFRASTDLANVKKYGG